MLLCQSELSSKMAETRKCLDEQMAKMAKITETHPEEIFQEESDDSVKDPDYIPSGLVKPILYYLLKV
jgi:hypothetical protein